MREFTGDWKDVFKGFRVALDVRKMLLGTVGLLLSVMMIAAFVMFLTKAAHPEVDEVSGGDQIFHMKQTVKEIFAPPLSVKVAIDAAMHGDCRSFRIAMRHILNPVSGPGSQVMLAALVLLSMGLGLWVIWAYLAGAITRIAAVEIAKDDRIELSEATEFARKRYRAYFWAPLSVLIAIAFFWACNAVVGLVCRIPVIGELGMAVLFPLALLSGFLMVLLVIGGSLGKQLMISAVSAEGTDSFDAVSRAFSYVLSRPWKFLWCVAMAVIYGIVTSAFVLFFAGAVAKVSVVAGWLGFANGTWYGGGMGAALNPIRYFLLNATVDNVHYNLANVWQMRPTLAIAGIAIGGWLTVLYAFAISYVISFCLSETTIIYFILRKDVDGTEVSEVFEEEDEEEFAPTPAPAGEKKDESGEAPADDATKDEGEKKDE